MSNAPYINWYTSDFLNGVVDLEAEQIGVYAVILTLIADRGSPIDDDPRWIARRAGTTTRKAKAIIATLESCGKIERRNGLIGNARMLREVRKRGQKSKQAREAANRKWEAWRAENKPQLPLEGTPGSGPSTNAPQPEQAEKTNLKSEKNATSSPEKTEIKSAVKSDKSQKPAENDMRTHPDSRARANPELESTTTTTAPKLRRDAREREADRPGVDLDGDLMALLERVGAVAGFVPRGASALVKAIDQVREWRNAGIDFDETVIPCVERIVADSDEPTHSLRRFDKAVRHQFAKQRAAQNLPTTPAPKPPKPVTQFDDEPDEMETLRKALLERLGERIYGRFLNPYRFEPVTRCGDEKPIRLVRREGAYVPSLDSFHNTIVDTAKSLGYTDVWRV